LPYRWVLSCGMRGVHVWPVKMHHDWQPVLLFGGVPPRWGSDAIRDLTPRRKVHHWGKSEMSMMQLIRRLTRPGALVCDPFVGGGTTAVACARTGRRFVGCDIDADAVAMTRKRLHELGLHAVDSEAATTRRRTVHRINEREGVA